MFKNLLLTTFRHIILAVALAFVPLAVSAQEIDMSLERTSVRKAVEYLQREYNYSISVRTDEVDIDRVVTVKAQRAALTEVLDQIFAGQAVEYVINGKSVSVKARKATAPTQESGPRIIRGKIYDDESTPPSPEQA